MPTEQGDKAAKTFYAAAEEIAILSSAHFGYVDRQRICDALNLILSRIDLVKHGPMGVVEEDYA